MRPSVRLVLRSGPRAGQVIPLESSEMSLGRDTSNDIVIEDPEVSRRHARLFVQGNSYFIEDLGSTNGTSISGQRLAGPYQLQNGDMITLGEHTNLVYEAVEADRPPTVNPPPREVPQAEPRRAPASTVQPAPPPPPYDAPPPRPVEYYNPPNQPYVDPYQPAQAVPPARRGLSPLVITLLVLVACLLLTCIVFAVIDTLNLYCTLFPDIVNLFVPGYCP